VNIVVDYEHSLDEHVNGDTCVWYIFPFFYFFFIDSDFEDFYDECQV